MERCKHSGCDRNVRYPFQKNYGRKVFEYVKRLDAIKNKECVKNSVNLLRISHADAWRDDKWLAQKLKEFVDGDS